MKLSELHTGEKGVIVKVLGHGGFRKRIVEMGFIKGKVVEALLNAPLQDPVKYKIMGYEVSLRHKEAEMIEIISMDEAKSLEKSYKGMGTIVKDDDAEDAPMTEERLHDVALRKRRTINVALVGNPNCGKTSLFNFVSGAHERVGNYSGVTVDAKEGYASFEGYDFNIIDLPGTYSLSAYSPEELYVRRQIIDKTPDVVLNVLDASNLERNLYLTTQLVDMHLRMICALNMYDEFEERGDQLDYKKLGQLFGVPMIPTVFKTGKGVDLLFHIIINMYEGVDFIDKKGNINPEVAKDIQDWHSKYEGHHGSNHGEDFAHGGKPRDSVFRHVHLNHGSCIEKGIEAIKAELKNDEQIRHKYSTRYLSIKLLEMDNETEKVVEQLPNAKKITEIRDREAARIKEELKEDSETAIMDAKYGLIHGALHEAGFKKGEQQDTYQVTHIIDGIITNRYIGFPVFFAILYLMFHATFTLGQYPMDWIETGISALAGLVSTTLNDGILKDLIVDGIIGGVGAVIVFLPQILILYGRLWLHVESRVHHGPPDAQDGTPRQVVHPAHYGIRMQRACCHGDTYHREPPFTPHHHAHTSNDELLGTIADIHNDDGDVLRHRIPKHHHDIALPHRHCHGSHNEPRLQQMAYQRRRHPVRHGAATLPFPDHPCHTAPHVGERQAVSQEDGWHNPRGKRHRVGTRILPPRRQSLAA